MILGVYSLICGIIDVGSNTIRLSLYKYENGEINLLLQKKTMAGLAGYVKNGALTKEGINTACEVLNKYKDILENFNIKKVFVFATASLRNIVNTDESVSYIQRNTGFKIDVILGEYEAQFDFAGASQIMNVTDGILIDIGGGSTEILSYEDKKIVSAYSIPIGSLSMYSKHVKSIFPTEQEVSDIKKEVISYLINLKEIKNSEEAIGVGGTIRATGKLFEKIYKGEVVKEVISTKNVKKVLKKYDYEENLLKKILKVCPDRVHTIIPGMVILNTISKYYGIETINVSPYGVREGYFFTKVVEGSGNFGEEKI